MLIWHLCLVRIIYLFMLVLLNHDCILPVLIQGLFGTFVLTRQSVFNTYLVLIIVYLHCKLSLWYESLFGERKYNFCDRLFDIRKWNRKGASYIEPHTNILEWSNRYLLFKNKAIWVIGHCFKLTKRLLFKLD